MVFHRFIWHNRKKATHLRMIPKPLLTKTQIMKKKQKKKTARNKICTQEKVSTINIQIETSLDSNVTPDKL